MVAKFPFFWYSRMGFSDHQPEYICVGNGGYSWRSSLRFPLVHRDAAHVTLLFHAAQAGLQPLDSSESPASASLSAGTTDLHPVWVATRVLSVEIDRDQHQEQKCK